MTADEEKELLELQAQVIRLRMLNNQYARHLLKQQPKKPLLGSLPVGQLFGQIGQVRPETWRAFATPNTVQNKLLMLGLTLLLGLLKKRRR